MVNPRHTRLVVLSALLIGTEGVSTIGCSSARHVQPHLSQRTEDERPIAVTVPANWHKVEAGAFAIFAPSGWEFHQLQGVDSYVGELAGEGAVLRFDFGRYSNPLKEEKKPAYVVVHKSIGGLRAKIVSPKTPGHGLTGIYFPRTFGSNKLCLFGQDLTPTQQELALEIFETIRFGGAVPRYVIPPPLPPKNAQ